MTISSAGSVAGQGNLIAYHGASGVAIEADASVGNSVLGNRIFDNGDPGPDDLGLDGSGGYVQLPSFDLGGALTIEAWVRLDHVPEAGTTLVDLGGASSGYDITLNWADDSGHMSFGANGYYAGTDGYFRPGWQSMTTSAAFPEGRWVHVAATVNSYGDGSIYWDGQLVSLGVVSVPFDWTRANQYLARSDASSFSAFNGGLADVAIWSGARTADQIGQDMATVATGGEPGLIAFYPLDDGSGTVARDRSPNHYDGTLASTARQFLRGTLRTRASPRPST